MLIVVHIVGRFQTSIFTTGTYKENNEAGWGRENDISRGAYAIR